VDTITIPVRFEDRVKAIEKLSQALMVCWVDSQIEVHYGKKTKKRSNLQCRYLNGVVYKMLSDATGYERDDISEYLCGTFFGWKDKRVPGKRIVQVPIRTTTRDADGNTSILTTQEFSEYVEFAQRFGARYNIIIPDPEGV
jgi:hypothetical protein